MDGLPPTIGRNFIDNWTLAWSKNQAKDQAEVDIVLESDARICGVEVKASSTVTGDDFRGLRRLAEAAGAKFAAGVILYDGEAIVRFGDRLFAVPVSKLWTGN